jgi:TonB-linked SusC/RagA family outer membrane protein
MTKFLSWFVMSVLSSVLALAQEKVITGKVTDQQGQPVAYATIRIKGTKQGLSADAEGNYAIKASEGTTLIVSGTGITSKEVVVGNSTNLDIQIARKTGMLTEVIVTTLGIQRQAKELGYSTAKIGNKELTQAKVTDFSTGLAGKVSGLQVNLTNNGVDPPTRIVLRGNRSITGNNQALLVLDGVVIDDVNYVNKINPEDIESVNILKGAVAAAIYGSKASNGVIVIITKHGTRGTPLITIGNTTQFERVSYMPKFQNTFGGYGGEGPPYTNPDGTVHNVPYENQSYGPPYDGSRTPLGLGVPRSFLPDGVTPAKLDTNFVTYSALPNNRRDFFNTGITNQFDISYSAGDEKGTFYMGFQDASINGVVPKDQSRRDNIRLNGSRTVGRFRADYSFSYNLRADDVVGYTYNQTAGGVFSGRPLYYELIQVPGYIPITSFKDWRNDIFADPNGYWNAYATNPYWSIDNSRQKTNTHDVLGSVNLSFKIAPWLTISDRVGLIETNKQYNYTRAGITFAPWAIADPWHAGNIPSSLQYLAPSTFKGTQQEQRISNDLILAGDKNFGNFSIRGLVGTNYYQRYQDNIFLEGDNLQFPGFYNIASVLGTPGYAEFSYKQREYSIFEELTLGYKDFLFLHLTNRDEWNSVLDPSLQHYEYPGADLSFIFTQGISSLKNSRVLSFGKIRGGVSQVANINIGNVNGFPATGLTFPFGPGFPPVNSYGAYSLVNPFNPTPGFPFGTLGGYSQANNTYLNPQIKPEITTAEEIGLELGFLNNRINFQAAAYSSVSKNQTLTAQITATTGFPSKIVNAGQITNKGLELDLRLTAVQTKYITWNIGLNYAHFVNRVDELLPGVNELQIGNFNESGNATPISGGLFAIKGLPYPVIKTTDWLRDAASGKVIVNPVTGMPSVDPNNKIYGTTNPTDILGINTNLSFRGFTLSAVVDYRTGNLIMNAIGENLDAEGVTYHSAENARQRFIFPNSVVLQGGKYVTNTSVAVNSGGNIGGAGFWPNIYNSGIGSPYLTSAAFWKLREVALTFEIPARVMTKLSFIKRATIGIVGRNLLMLRPKSNFWTDPEFSETNHNDVGKTSENQTPPTRIYGANITLTF